MEHLPLIVSVAFINLVAAISPGPDFVMCVKNSVTYSRKTGIYTGIGIGLGLSVHIAYCMAGIGLVISQSIILFNIIKLLGAFYLIYMGIRTIFAKGSALHIEEGGKAADISAHAAIKSGFLCNVLNPKATMFFLALFAMVIGPGIPRHIVLIASLIMILTAIAWFALVATLFSQNWIRNKFRRFERAIHGVFGGLLLLLGLKVALTRT